MLPQDLHIHTTYSASDNSVLPEQTVALVAAVKHAAIVGISDHLENLVNGLFDAHAKEVRRFGLKVGIEVDYYILRCRGQDADYLALETLLGTEKPIIVAHPNANPTNLDRVPPDCLIEINNRYV